MPTSDVRDIEVADACSTSDKAMVTWHAGSTAGRVARISRPWPGHKSSHWRARPPSLTAWHMPEQMPDQLQEKTLVLPDEVHRSHAEHEADHASYVTVFDKWCYLGAVWCKRPPPQPSSLTPQPFQESKLLCSAIRKNILAACRDRHEEVFSITFEAGLTARRTLAWAWAPKKYINRNLLDHLKSRNWVQWFCLMGHGIFEKGFILRATNG